MGVTGADILDMPLAKFNRTYFVVLKEKRSFSAFTPFLIIISVAQPRAIRGLP